MASGPAEEHESDSDADSDSSSEDEEPQITGAGSGETVNIDFEARSPEESDYSSIQRLLKQLLPTGVNLTDLTNLVLSQSYVGAVIFQPTDDGPAEPEDDGEEDVFGITTMINLTARAKQDSVKDLIAYLKEKFESKDNCALNQEKFVEFFSEKLKNTGWIINERFVNLPSQIAPDLFQSLKDDINDAVKKSMPYSVGQYLVVAKAHVPNGGSAHNPVFVNDEEELFFQSSVASFSYRLDNNTATASAEWKNKKDKELHPIRVVMLVEPSVVDKEIANFRALFSV